MRRSALFWGTILIIFGALLLLQNLGFINFDIWGIAWALFLIALGVYILLGKTMRSGASSGEPVSIPIEDAELVHIRINHGAGRLAIGGSTGPGEAASGWFHGGVECRSRKNGSTLDVSLRVPSPSFIWFGGWSPQDWQLALNSQVPLALDLETGASETQADLSAYQVTDVRLKTGASSTNLIFPAQAVMTRARVESGVASVNLKIPPGVSARIQVRSGLAGVTIDQSRFPRQGDLYISPDYYQAANRIDLDVQTGVGAVDVR